MNSENDIMPSPKKYGCHFAIPGNISSRRNSVGIRKYVRPMNASVVPTTTVAWKWPGT